MDKTQNPYTKYKKPYEEMLHTVELYFYKQSRIGESKGTDNRLVIIRDFGEGRRVNDTLMDMGFLLEQ